jgi:hypothetical protein
LRNRIKNTVLLLSLLCWVFTLVNGVQATSFFDHFIDPHDGKFDTSNWRLKHKGFLPVLIIHSGGRQGLTAAACQCHQKRPHEVCC